MAVTSLQTEPEKIPDSEYYVKLSSRERPHKIVDAPQTDPKTGEPLGKLAMRVLTQQEIIAAKADSTAFARTIFKDKKDSLDEIEKSAVWRDACACELLFRSARRPDNLKLPIWPTAKAIRESLTSDELGVLVNSYEFVQLELGPIAAYLSEAEQDAIIKRLQEGGSAVPLALLSLAQWTALTMRMASLLANSRTGSSSLTSPPEDPTLTNETE